jgi:hypothetical protein
MNQHPLIRAYLAGIAIPTVFLLVAISVYTTLRYVYGLPVPIERLIVFPMALVPNLWGLWNILYTALLAPRHVSIGLFGGLLPLFLAPLGYFIAHILQFPIPHQVFSIAPVGLPIGMILYYLLWKYFVSSLNAELGIG